MSHTDNIYIVFRVLKGQKDEGWWRGKLTIIK